MFKFMTLAILFDKFLNSSFKMTTNVVSIARTTASTSDFLGGLYMKSNFLSLNELKTSLMLKFSTQNSLQSF